jgi:glycosyltransferase involved in cell wall biosynthesis
VGRALGRAEHSPQFAAERRAVLRAAGLPSPMRPAVDLRPAFVPPPSPSVPKVRRALALIATRSFLPFAKLATSSFLTHHPEFHAFLLLVDGKPQDKAVFAEGRVVLLSEVGLDRVGWYAAKFTAAEFANALKPVFLRYLSGFAESVVYLDSDIAVFSRLGEMIDQLDACDLVLIPHVLTPLPRPERYWTRPSRSDLFNSGLVNAGCFAIRLAECREFLAFWEEANLGPGAFYEPAGYQTDQQHLNWALVSVPGARLLREPRYNVAYWNLHERDFRAEAAPDGALDYTVDGKPLGFFHFSGYDIAERLRLSRHDGRHSVYNMPAVAAILDWYSTQILASPAAGLRHESYRFDRLANGFELNRFIRELLKKYEPYAPRFDLRTSTGADALCAFLMDPLPAAGSLLPLVAAEIYEARSDIRQNWPGAHTSVSPDDYWRWFCRHAGEEYSIQFLIDNFRRTLISDASHGLAKQISTTLASDCAGFFGPDRLLAVEALRLAGENELADTLAEARTEWYFFGELSAIFKIYTNRPDLRTAFPDIFGRDHAAFCEWLEGHAEAEHDCPPGAAERFRRRSADTALARAFSYLSRREDIARACQDTLLSDDPEPVLRALVRDAGEGLEYDLDDVVIVQHIHDLSRHLLVPLYLELPLVRQRSDASRVANQNLDALPETVRATAWARRGCEMHAACFDRFEARLDEEMRRWGAALAVPARNVVGFLQTARNAEQAIRLVEPAFRKAARGLPVDGAAIGGPTSYLSERERRPGVNVFGYFASDIGVGESSRGLAQAIALLRPVNRVPFCTAQVRDGTRLCELFQRFDYLTDTNVFVSYPHQDEDLLGMMRSEHLLGRRNVAHLAWEQKDANPWWKAVYDRYDEIWTISAFAATPFRRLFPGRVRVVPNVLDFERFPRCPEADSERLRGDCVKFLFVFDANSSIERKNPEAVVAAFVKAFKGTRNAARARLTLKVGGMHRPEHALRVERLMRAAGESGLAIGFDGRHLARADLLRMIAEADCYVSLHRAEGFGYTMAEAMFYGVPVIASEYSGNLEYMTRENSFLVPCTETFVRDADGPFQRGSVWGEPDIDTAADLLRRALERPADFLTVGERGRSAVITKLSADAVAQTIRPYFAGAASREESRKAAE